MEHQSQVFRKCSALGQPLYLICCSGERSRKAYKRLVAAGFTNVVEVRGGTLAWAECGLPIVRGKTTISLEYQAQIALGFLIVFGALLAWYVHPAWALLSAIVGAALVYTGITDSYLVAILLIFAL